MLKAFLKKSTAEPTAPIFTFDADALARRAEGLRAGYAAAEPFPHVVIDGLLPEGVAERLVQVFPKPDAPFWLERDTVNQPGKQGVGNASRLEGVDPFIHNVLFALNSYPFIRFLEILTGIDGLIPDPHLHGGGIHQILPGGKLAVHADFNYLPKLKLYRKLNLLLYLNQDWRKEYGGDLELWDKEMKRPVQSIAPLLNRAVIFNTGRYSYHGHPAPLTCPPGETRKSMALYYYGRDPGEGDDTHHTTLWQQT